MNNMELEIQKLKETNSMEQYIKKLNEIIKWYEDYAKVVYQNKPNIDQYACDYADEQQELRSK